MVSNKIIYVMLSVSVNRTRIHTHFQKSEKDYCFKIIEKAHTIRNKVKLQKILRIE
jgi:hypothetical protein